MRSSSQPIQRAEPESVGLSRERLERIGAALRSEIAAGKLPGAVLGIARRGKLAYLEAFGSSRPAGGNRRCPWTLSSASRR